MGDLGKAKVDLGIYINVSNVGITERVEDAVSPFVPEFLRLSRRE